MYIQNCTRKKDTSGRRGAKKCLKMRGFLCTKPTVELATFYTNAFREIYMYLPHRPDVRQSVPPGWAG